MSLKDLGDSLRKRREEAEAFRKSLQGATKAAGDLPSAPVAVTTGRGGTSITVTDSIAPTGQQGNGYFGLSAGNRPIPMQVQALAEEVARVTNLAKETATTVSEETVTTRNLARVMQESFAQNTATFARALAPGLGLILHRAYKENTPSFVAEVRKVVKEAMPSASVGGGGGSKPAGQCSGSAPAPSTSANIMRWSGMTR